MNKLRKLIDYTFKDPKKLLLAILVRITPIVPDKLYLRWMFRLRTGYKLDLDNPKTFNEKLQWLKLYNRKPEYAQMVDKFLVKKLVAGILGQECIIPTLGVYNSADEIDFDALPNQFVLKCTHDSGLAFICKDKAKFNRADAIKKLNQSLKHNYYWLSREWPYKNVKPRIIAEKYMIDDSISELRDYKFFCFNGRVEYFKVDFDRFIKHRANYFDRNGNVMPFGEVACLPDYDRDIKLPDTLSRMIEIAEQLSKNIGPFARIDLYSANDKIYFGEITFFPAGGFGKFTDAQWDKNLGDLICLN